MEFWSLVGDLTVLLCAAALLGIVAEKVGMSAVVGYLIAGTLVGPGVLDVVSSDEDVIREMAEIGVALLLFTLGLEIDGTRLKQLLGRSLFLGFGELFGAGLLGFCVAKAFHADLQTAIIIGAMAALSSTAVVAKVLQNRAELDAQHGRATIAVLVLQDIAIVPLMILVSVLAAQQGELSVAFLLGGAAAKLAVLLIVIFLVGILILPRLFGAALIRRSAELPIVVGIVTCLSAMWLAHQLGASPALGAFIAGLILAGSPFAAQVRGDIAPFRSIFLTLFFVATGMLANLPWLIHGYHLLWVIGVAGGIVLGKTVVVWVTGIALGIPRRVSIASGLCLAQIGEFSFVLGTAAMTGGLISDEVFQLMISASILTLLASPLLISRSRRIATAIDSIFKQTKHEEPDNAIASMRNHVIVLGYGVSGKSVSTALLESGNEVLVIDMGPVGVLQAKKDGAIALIGNAQRRDVLVHAGVTSAKMLITTLPDYRSTVETIDQVRSISSSIPIVARARYSRHATALHTAGADHVVDEEACVGRTLAQQTLRQLGL
ncbi:MAG: cation:proton antiporter [Phycisphaerales bacterium]|nr:cation:proton antiporter [Phycisphaerales bacterium]